jgi:hypothetical protein
MDMRATLGARAVFSKSRENMVKGVRVWSGVSSHGLPEDSIFPPGDLG